MNKAEFIQPIRVYYEDTDVAGVVYYANYLKFYERARTEWLRKLGYEQDVLIDKGLAFAVAKVEAEYLYPARFNDKLLVITRVIKSGRASMVFDQRVVTDDEQQKELNKAVIKVACVDLKSMLPKAMPKYLQEEIASGWC